MSVDDAAKAKLAADTYFDATNTIRHYDTQRATFASLSLSVAFLTGFAATQAKAGGSVMILRALSIAGLLIAVLSCVVVRKFASLINRHRRRARFAANFLNDNFGMGAVNAIDEAVRQGEKHRLWASIPLDLLWVAMFMIFVVIECLALIFARTLVSL